MVRLLLLSVLLSLPLTILATHNQGGYIQYKHVDGLTYEITLTTFTKTGGPSNSSDRCEINIDFGDGSSQLVQRTNGDAAMGCPHGGVSIAPTLKLNEYVTTHTFPGTGVFIISMEDPNRNDGIVNIPNSTTQPLFLKSRLVIVDGQDEINSSIRLGQLPIFEHLVGYANRYNLTAIDPDGDSLTYELVNPLGADGEIIADYTLPAGMTINPSSGTISWTPLLQGEFNVTVRIKEWRFNRSVGETLVDLLLVSSICDVEQTSYSGVDQFEIDADGNYFITVTALDTLLLFPDYVFTGINADGQLSLLAAGETFEIDQPATFETIEFPHQVVGWYTWVPRHQHVRENPYLLVLRAKTDENVCVWEEDLAIKIYVEPFFPTGSPTIETTDEVRIYPNPVRENLYLELNESSYQEAIIYDARGKLVHAKPISRRLGQLQLDVSKLETGLYFLELRGTETSFTSRFVRF